MNFLIGLTISIITLGYVLTDSDVIKIKTSACDSTNKFIESVDFNREQAKLYGYNDTYKIDPEKLKEHNELCSGTGIIIGE